MYFIDIMYLILVCVWGLRRADLVRTFMKFERTPSAVSCLLILYTWYVVVFFLSRRTSRGGIPPGSAV